MMIWLIFQNYYNFVWFLKNIFADFWCGHTETRQRQRHLLGANQANHLQAESDKE